MDDDSGGIPITLNSTLVLGALAMCCCSVVTVVAVWQAQGETDWTTAHTAVGIICAGLAGLAALTMAAIVTVRKTRLFRR